MISERLQCILKYAQGNIVADVGTDHAYIPIELVREGKAQRAIASDINKGPLDIAQSNICEAGFEDKIETRLGGGLSVLKEGEADLIIIAGMGGELIQSIIEADKAVAMASRLIIQPMNEQYELRKYLMSSGFVIEEEDIAVEGFKVYNIMLVKKGEAVAFEKDIYYHLPPYLKDNKNYGMLYAKKEREFVRVIDGLEKSKDTDREKLNKYKEWFSELEILKTV